jgi:hypothetical protein
MIPRNAFVGAFAALSLLTAASALAQPVEMTVLSYNVAGQPPAATEIDSFDNIPLIAARLNSSEFDLVAIQEGFVHGFDDPSPSSESFGVGALFYSQLTLMNATPNDFQFPPVDAPTGGSLSVASGLLRLSAPEFTGFVRTKWDTMFGVLGQNGGDEDSDKGFSFARHQLAPGLAVDIYNWHADAGYDDGQDIGSIAARADNVGQLIAAINANSVDNAVFVLGDTNSRYTRPEDVIRDLVTAALASATGSVGTPIDDPLTDVWVELVRAGMIPPQTGTDLDSGCATDLAGAGCESVDKIFYRSGANVMLTPTGYFVRTDFVDGADQDLSDHLPTGAVFTVPEPTVAPAVALLCLGLLARSRSRRDSSR